MKIPEQVTIALASSWGPVPAGRLTEGQISVLRKPALK